MELFIPVNARTVIETAVPLKERSQIVTLVEQGYALADEALKINPFLSWELGEDKRGYLRPIAISYLIKREIDNGRLPFRYSFEWNRNKSHRYLLVHTDNVKITLSQVKYKHSIARPAYFRDKLQQANQITMRFSEDSFNVQEGHYLLLTFSSGGKFPTFINLGMPNEKGWLDKPINMLTELRLIDGGMNKEKEIVIEEEQLVGFRSFIKEVEEGGR